MMPYLLVICVHLIILFITSSFQYLLIDSADPENNISATSNYDHASASRRFIVNVDWYGAVGDGTTDDTQALANAWIDACSAVAPSIHLLIPPRKAYLVNALQFVGPCAASSVVLELAGSLVAPPDPLSWRRRIAYAWLQFRNLSNVVVQGGGHVDGRGQKWWEESCKWNKAIKKCSRWPAPNALTFRYVNGLDVSGISSLNGPRMHIILSHCTHVRLIKVNIQAPSGSPNTDGIHVSSSQHVVIQDTAIATGDDCISIVNHSDDIQVRNITCGPGHGISIGSLGKGGFDDRVSRVVVDGAKLAGTTNGLRIKTWRGGTGTAADFRFENVDMVNVSFPIIIDQNYCDPSDTCPALETSAVRVSNVLYRNIQGTSATKQAIKLACSTIAPCTGLHFENINLRPLPIRTAAAAALLEPPTSSSSDDHHRHPTSSIPFPFSYTIASFCQSAHVLTAGTVVPTLRSCLQRQELPPPSAVHAHRAALFKLSSLD